MESTTKAKQTPPPPPAGPTADSSGGGGEDRISALDDDLCDLILRLAHLNVRELVRTSVLSKRWRGLWRRSPVLDFFGWPELESAGDVRQYIATVNDVLEQRAGAASEARIDELKIPLVFYYPRKQQFCTPAMRAAAMKAAEVWIRYAMHHQVKAFQLNLVRRPVGVHEVCVLDLDELLPSSPKLECLHLELSKIQVQLPRAAVFTSLKDLTLDFVELAAGSCHLLARLLSSVCCPSLQKLRLRQVSFEDDGTNELVLDAGELLELYMVHVYDMELLELRTPKLLYLEIDGCEHTKLLRISAPGLKELSYFKNKSFIQGCLPCVQRLKIDLYTYYMDEGDDDDEDPNRSNIYLLKLCGSSVRRLLVQLCVPPEEEDDVDLIKDIIPQLPNVTSLLVTISVPSERHTFVDGVASLLTRFKNLEYLSLVRDDIFVYSEDDVEAGDHQHHWKLNDIYLAKLREADFRGMTGSGCELRFLWFVLASAIDIRSVTVSFDLCFIEEEVQDSRIHYFLHSLLGDGTWATLEDEDLANKPDNSSKLYKWAPSP